MLSSSPMIDKTLQVKDFYSEVKRVILTKEPYKSYFGNNNLLNAFFIISGNIFFTSILFKSLLSLTD